MKATYDLYVAFFIALIYFQLEHRHHLFKAGTS